MLQDIFLISLMACMACFLLRYLKSYSTTKLNIEKNYRDTPFGPKKLKSYKESSKF